MGKIKYIDRQTGNVLEENPPAEGMLRFFYGNPIGRLGLDMLVKRKFVSSWYGTQMDKPSSKNKISSFVKEMEIDMSESIKSIGEFTTFNDFFYRKLHPHARPIGDGLISPGDGRLLAFENAEDVNSFYIKGRDFKVSEYLANQKLIDKYKDAQMIILRLAPNDYHRYHFPYQGVASPFQLIKGYYYSVSPIALAENFTKVFCENKRGYTILKTEGKGDILISPVAATMVGSMIHTYDADKSVNVGDEMGYFAFGGSTIVMFLEKGKFKIGSDLIANTKEGIETYVKMGEMIGN